MGCTLETACVCVSQADEEITVLLCILLVDDMRRTEPDSEWCENCFSH